MTDLGAYPHRETLQTRWKDNDVYGHVNNVEYYSYFDTVINTWLIREGGLDVAGGPVIGVCAESRCTFLGSLSFPEPIDAYLRVEHLGTSSVRYGIALAAVSSPEPAAVGAFVHVFVDRRTRRPVQIPGALRSCLERLAAPAPPGGWPGG